MLRELLCRLCGAGKMELIGYCEYVNNIDAMHIYKATEATCILNK